MSKLQILIPQYNEDENMIKPLLDSIAIQQDVDLKQDIEVFIGNDGSDVKLSTDFLKQYPFKIQYHFFEHARLAATRQKLFDLVTAPYVMWCDADDRFISTIALSMIMQYIHNGFDALIFDIVEQNAFPDGRVVYIPRKNDCIFVHGKIYRTEFLKENHIKWHPELHEHQDSPFNVLARTLAKKSYNCPLVIYMWCNNRKSISRINGIYHLVNTWPHMIDSYQALVDDFKDRGLGHHARYYAKYCLYASYYEMAHSVWFQDDVVERKAIACKRIFDFYNKNKLLILNCPENLTSHIDETNKELAKKHGPFDKRMPSFDEWLNSILTLYQG